MSETDKSFREDNAVDPSSEAMPVLARMQRYIRDSRVRHGGLRIGRRRRPRSLSADDPILLGSPVSYALLQEGDRAAGWMQTGGYEAAVQRRKVVGVGYVS